MSETELALNPHWKKRIADIGMMNFVREEMLRLGFYTEIDEQEKERLLAFLNKALPRLAKFKKELKQISDEIEEIDDVQALLKEVRRERIERVKREREIERAEKQRLETERKAAWLEKKKRKPPFLGTKVSARLQFEGGDEKALRARKLPVLNDANDLASLMNISTGELFWLCYERAATSIDHYIRFEIPKKSGGKRLISSPKQKMRAAQSWVVENVLSKISPSGAATAFHPGASILVNAEPHLKAAIVIRMDFKDFFPSITFPRIRGYFEYLGFNPGIASLFALISTDAPRVKVTLDGKSQFVATGQRSLPQGACTSPMLANLVARKLDARISGLLNKSTDEWRYTRYADDLTFSTHNSDANVGRLLRSIQNISTDEGFLINPKKTNVMRSPGRRIVTGLVVDDEIKISRRDLRRLRAFLHRCEVTGLDQVSDEIGKNALSVAQGRLAFVQMVMPERAQEIRNKHSWL